MFQVDVPVQVVNSLPGNKTGIKTNNNKQFNNKTSARAKPSTEGEYQVSFHVDNKFHHEKEGLNIVLLIFLPYRTRKRCL